MVEFQSKIFGRLEIDENEVFDFPAGILGFPERKKFFFLKIINDNLPFQVEVMHSFDADNLAFLVTDPSYIFPTYTILASPKDLEEIKVKDISDVALRVILRVEKGGKMTANFIAPIVINTRDRIGKHLVLEGSDDLLDVEIDLSKGSKEAVGQTSVMQPTKK